MAGNESRGKMTFGSRRKDPLVFFSEMNRSRLRAAVMGLGAGHVSRVSRKTEPSAWARRKKNAVSSRNAAAARKSRARHTTHTTYLAARSANARTAADTRRDRTRAEFEVAAFDRVAIHEDTRETHTRFAAEETAESASETSESPSGRAPFAASGAAFAAAASNVSNADSIDDSTETGSTLDGFDGFDDRDDRGAASGTTAAETSYGGAARGELSTDPSFGIERCFVSSSRFRTNATKSFVASRTREGPANAGKGEGVSGSDADASNEDASSVLEGFEGFEDVDVDVSRLLSVEKPARGVPGVIESRDASLDV